MTGQERDIVGRGKRVVGDTKEAQVEEGRGGAGCGT